MLSRLLRALGTLALFVAALFFALLTLGGHLQLLDARRVMAEGQVTQGTVTGLRKGTGKSSSYYFTYEFFAGGAKHAKTDVSVSYDAFHALRNGSKVKVWYDPANPAASATQQERDEFEFWPNRLLLPGITALLLGAWIWRLVRRPPSSPAAPPSPAKPQPASRFVNPIRRGD
jgi:hypothetical protein